jgi:hypothetical protein
LFLNEILKIFLKNRSVLHPRAVMQRRVKMKFFRYCLMGMLVFICMFGSCSMGGAEAEDFSETEETSQEEEETASDEETLSEGENPDETQDETQDDPEEIPPAPIFLYCKTVSQNEIVFGFSQPVTMVDFCLIPEMEREIASELECEITEEGRTITVSLAEDLESGQILTADFLAEDAYGNSVEKRVRFSSTPTSAPALQINELRTEYSGSSNPKKAEYIEFKMLSDGNLGALRVFAEGYDKDPLIYEFAPVEVKKGEYVVLHLRTLEESCKNEYGENLNESGGTDSCPTARDLWIPGLDKKQLHKTDAVYVLDQNDWVLDAVMISEKPDPSWNKTYFAKAAEFLFNQGAWESPQGGICNPLNAVDSSGIKTAATKSISRYEAAENTHTAADWYITTAGGITPGLPNKP